MISRKSIFGAVAIVSLSLTSDMSRGAPEGQSYVVEYRLDERKTAHFEDSDGATTFHDALAKLRGEIEKTGSSGNCARGTACLRRLVESTRAIDVDFENARSGSPAPEGATHNSQGREPLDREDNQDRSPVRQRREGFQPRRVGLAPPFSLRVRPFGWWAKAHPTQEDTGCSRHKVLHGVAPKGRHKTCGYDVHGTEGEGSTRRPPLDSCRRSAAEERRSDALR